MFYFSFQWTLLAFDAAYPLPPSMLATPPGHIPSNSWQRGSTRNTQIMSSVRISPFPSPAPTLPSGEGGPLNYAGGIGGRRGAFTPYRQVMKRQKYSSPVIVSLDAASDYSCSIFVVNRPCIWSANTVLVCCNTRAEPMHMLLAHLSLLSFCQSLYSPLSPDILFPK